MGHRVSAKQPLRRSSRARFVVFSASSISPFYAKRCGVKDVIRIQVATNALHAGGSVVWVGKERFSYSAHKFFIF